MFTPIAQLRLVSLLACFYAVLISIVHFHTKAPHQYLVLSSEDQRSRGRLSQDLCVIDGEQHFIRGLIEVRSTDKPAGEVVLVFGVYAFLSYALAYIVQSRTTHRCVTGGRRCPRMFLRELLRRGQKLAERKKQLQSALPRTRN